jgi:ubiquinone/menaquinone biosynthesis C-methylase UbiE
MDQDKIVTSAQEISETASAFMKSRVLLTAFELDLFTALGDKTLGPAEVASRVGADERAMDRLLGALTAMGFAIKADGKYSAPEAVRKHLDRNSPDYLAELAHTANQYRNWGTLTRAVKHGTSVIDLAFDDDTRREDFIGAMHSRAKKRAPEAVDLIDLADVHRVLDVGGGSGAFSMEMCRRKPGVEAVVLDLPEVIPLTRKYVAQEGFSECIDVMDGDYMTTDFGSGYDLVLFSAILHINSPRENQALLKKAYRALEPGGHIAVLDFIMDEERIHPPRGAVFALNMLINTSAGDSYTASEISGWLSEAGCVDVELKQASPTTSMMFGAKPIA